mmetsp:Transcript_265/g.768  ORF Transcript_265/g.768 Transcript_265/m.768 type:complete len:204 (+) Transcript_265:1549-2160(+)
MGWQECMPAVACARVPASCCICQRTSPMTSCSVDRCSAASPLDSSPQYHNTPTISRRERLREPANAVRKLQQAAVVTETRAVLAAAATAAAGPSVAATAVAVVANPEWMDRTATGLVKTEARRSAVSLLVMPSRRARRTQRLKRKVSQTRSQTCNPWTSQTTQEPGMMLAVAAQEPQMATMQPANQVRTFHRRKQNLTWCSSG